MCAAQVRRQQAPQAGSTATVRPMYKRWRQNEVWMNDITTRPETLFTATAPTSVRPFAWAVKPVPGELVVPSSVPESGWYGHGGWW